MKIFACPGAGTPDHARIRLPRLALCALLVCVLCLGGCGREKKAKVDKGPPLVSIVTVQSEAVALSTELPGRTSPYALAAIVPQISGIILSRSFREGADVRAGQLLYQIDPAPYKAAFDQAKAQLAYAVANIQTTKLQAERYTALIKIDGVSHQDLDNANAAYGQAVALVGEDRAALESARINLAYTRIVSPITGRVGTSSFTQGALVVANQTNSLTTVQTLDPIYIDITQSTAELLKLRHSLANGTLAKDKSSIAGVRLKLEDGSDYPLPGTLELTDITVDQTTGSVTLRAIFANPDGILLPGMYVHAIVPQAINPAGILVPEQSVSHDQKGQAVAMIVDADGKAQSQPIDTTTVIGDKWLVTNGLKAGDRVIIEGLQTAKPGVAVTIVPVGAVPQSPAPAEKTDKQ